jgi:hypothetical protein
MPMYHGMDLAQFKKVKSDDQCTTLRHAKGHEIKIAHKALNPKLKEMIGGMPMFEGGGSVPVDDSSPATASDTPADVPDSAAGTGAGPQSPPEEPPMGNMEMQSQQNGNAPPSTPNVVDQIPADTGNDVTVTAPPAPTVPDPVQQQAERQAEFQDQSKMTPQTMNSLYASKDTPGKIGMALGMLLSGAGSGLAHQPNALLDILNKQMDRDLDAQKSSNQNSQNWFRLNQQNEMNKANIKHTNASTDVLAADATKGQMANAAYFQATDIAKNFPPEVRDQILNRIHGEMEPWRQGVINQSATDTANKLRMVSLQGGQKFQDGVDVDGINHALTGMNLTKLGPGISPQSFIDAKTGYQQTSRLNDDFKPAFDNLNTKSAEQLGEAAGVTTGAMSHLAKALGSLPGAGGTVANVASSLVDPLDRDTYQKMDTYRKSQIEPVMARMGPMETQSTAMGAGNDIRDAIFPSVYDMASQVGMTSRSLDQLREAKFTAAQNMIANRAGTFASTLDALPGGKLYQPITRYKYKHIAEDKEDPAAANAAESQQAPTPVPTPFGG